MSNENVEMSNENVGMSPKPTVETKKEMDFGEAMQQVLLGKKIHKLEWNDFGFYGVLENGFVKLHKPDGKLYNWIISDGDLAGDDYITI